MLQVTRDKIRKHYESLFLAWEFWKRHYWAAKWDALIEFQFIPKHADGSTSRITDRLMLTSVVFRQNNNFTFL